MRHLSILIALAAALLLGACSQQAPAAEQPTAEQPSTSAPAPVATGEGGAYPAPAAYPGPSPEADLGPTVSAEPIVVPQQPSSAQVGVVTGTLMNTSDGGSEPVAGYNIYLGAILKNDQGADSLVQLDKGVAPRTNLNALGEFLFNDVPPGRYGLMLDLPRGAVLLNNPESGEDLIIEIKGGEVVQLGEMGYPLPRQ